MKGFGDKYKNKKVSIENKIKPLQQDQLIKRAFSLHSSGKIKEKLIKKGMNSHMLQN